MLSVVSFSNGNSGTNDDDLSPYNFTNTNFGLLLDDDPGWKVTTALFDDFLHCAVKRPAQHQILSLVDEYEQLCEDQTIILDKVLERTSQGDAKFTRTVEILNQIREELFSWRLVRIMFEDRLEKQPREMMDSSDLPTPLSTMDDKCYFEQLLTTEKSLREFKLIRNWCEQNATTQLQDGAALKAFEKKTFLWDASLHNLKAGKSGKTLNDMDPDAPLYGQKLDDADAGYDDALVAMLFVYVRSGNIQKAVDLCVHCGQSWRAASLLGAQLYSNPNCRSDGSGQLEKVSGNANRSLWKRMCWLMAEKKQVSIAERALYGSLSGRLSAVLPMATSWQDKLWSYVISVSEYQLDYHLSGLAKIHGKTWTSLPPCPDDQVDFTLEEIFNELHTFTSDQTINPYEEIQKFIMLNDAASAVDFMHKYLSDATEEDDIGPPRHLVRFMAHLVLIYKQLALEIPDALANGVLELYVRQLSEDEKCLHLVAFYASSLPIQLQIRSYSALMQRINNNDQRKECLRLAEEADMDVAELCRTTVENIRNEYATGKDETNDTIERAHVDDDRFVSSLEWLTFDPILSIDAIIHSNAALRLLIARNKVDVARKAVDRISDDCVNVVPLVWQRDNGDQPMPVEYTNAIKEHLCYRAYLDSLDAFNTWSDHFYRTKPIKPTISDVTTMSFTEQAEQEMRQKQFERDMERWKQTLDLYEQSATQMLYNVLLFPEGGWLVDIELLIDQEERHDEMCNLRSNVLPTIASLLLNVFQCGKRYRDAMQLAQTIASEEGQLFKAFGSEQLKHLLKKLTECAAEAVDSNFDCVGCIK